MFYIISFFPFLDDCKNIQTILLPQPVFLTNFSEKICSLKRKLYICSPKTGDSLAQQVEHNTCNVGVLGSSPRRITKKPSFLKAFFIYTTYPHHLPITTTTFRTKHPFRAPNLLFHHNFSHIIHSSCENMPSLQKLFAPNTRFVHQTNAYMHTTGGTALELSCAAC